MYRDYLCLNRYNTLVVLNLIYFCTILYNAQISWFHSFFSRKNKKPYTCLSQHCKICAHERSLEGLNLFIPMKLFPVLHERVDFYCNTILCIGIPTSSLLSLLAALPLIRNSYIKLESINNPFIRGLRLTLKLINMYWLHIYEIILFVKSSIYEYLT